VAVDKAGVGAAPVGIDALNYYAINCIQLVAPSHRDKTVSFMDGELW